MLISSKTRWALMHENTNDDEPRLIDLLKILEGFESDLILVEGFKAEKFPKIELYRKDIAKDLLCTTDDSIIAVASDSKIEKNIGYGHGIMAGVNVASGNYIGWCHADWQTEPIDILNAYTKNLNAIENELCVIKGLRKNRNFFDSMFTFGMSLFASIIFLKKINDINAQPKIFPKTFLNYLKEYPKDFSLDLYFLVMAKINNYRCASNS